VLLSAIFNHQRKSFPPEKKGEPPSCLLRHTQLGGKIDFEGRKKNYYFRGKKIEPKRASERQKKKLRIGNYFYNLSDGNKGKERVSGRQHEICAPLSTFVSV
jgi:hypothetical protein